MKGLQLASNLKTSIWVCLTVCVVLVAIKILSGLPNPFLLFLGTTLVACSSIVLLMSGRHTVQQPVLSIRLIAIWSVTTSLLLSTVYRIDRAGWIWFSLTGFNITWSEDLEKGSYLSIDQFVDQNQAFIRNPDDTAGLLLPKGNYEFDQTVIIPRGASLTIEPGTILRFAAGRSLVCYGPLLARGIGEKITFQAKNKWLKWGSIGIIAPDHESILENVLFENARQAEVNGIIMPGGLSVINSKVSIRNSEFTDMFGKDAVYVNHGSVTIVNNFFRNAFKDGLDLDGGSGEITGNLFVSCGDEGIDLSENMNINVHDNKILARTGGKISADVNLENIRSSNTLGVTGTLDTQHKSL